MVRREGSRAGGDRCRWRWRALAAGAALLAALPWAVPVQASVWPSTHERVARALGSTDRAERRAAARQLVELPPEIGRPLARRALLDPDEAVRLAAARAAAVLGVVGAGDRVVPWLSDLDPRLRAAACELIEVSPTPNSVRALARVLGDADANVRKAAAAAMGSSGSDEVVSPLLGHLDDKEVAVRLEVVRALGRIGDRRAVLPLVSKLRDAEADVRRAAARALSTLGDPRAEPSLVLALQDADASVRVQALRALGRLRAADAVSAIAALLQAPEASVGALAWSDAVRRAALEALGRIGSPEAVRILIGQLALEGGRLPLHWLAEPTRGAVDPAPVRQALALAGEPAVAALLSALRSSASQRLASGAALALGELGATAALPEIVRAAQRGTVTMDAACFALAALGDARALPFLLEHLDDPDPQVRRLAIAVAAELCDPAAPDGRVVDPIRPRVLDLRTPMAERIALVELLGRSGSVRAREVLLSLGDVEHPGLRRSIVEALGWTGKPTAPTLDRLFDALSAPATELRRAAALSLARVGGDSSARRLLHRLGEAAEQDRGAIGIALSGSLAKARDPELVALVRGALAVAPPAARDALIEGLGRMSAPSAGALLVELGRVADADDRRKVAEALAGHPARRAALRRMLLDPDPAVRANAVWSLGLTGVADDLSAVTPLFGDADVAVAGNAVVAASLIAVRSPTASAPTDALCATLDDFRSYVRANALVALRLAGGGCPAGRVRQLLARDRSWRVRLGAADLLQASLEAAPPEQRLRDRRALARCVAEDGDATVARHCRQGRSAVTGHDPLVAFVVPHDRTAPVARAPFALVRPDGSMRLGVADRRGALFEHRCPRGTIELALPAPLAP